MAVSNFKKKVREGCVPSTQLLILYSQFVFRKALEERYEGVNIEGTLTNNLRFADNTAIIAECAEDRQTLFERVN